MVSNSFRVGKVNDTELFIDGNHMLQPKAKAYEPFVLAWAIPVVAEPKDSTLALKD